MSSTTSVKGRDDRETQKPRFSVQKLFKKSKAVDQTIERKPRYNHVPQCARKGHIMTTFQVVSPTSNKDAMNFSSCETPVESLSTGSLSSEGCHSIDSYASHAHQLSTALNNVIVQDPPRYASRYDLDLDETVESSCASTPEFYSISANPNRFRDSGIVDIEFDESSHHKRKPTASSQTFGRSFRDSAHGDDLEGEKL